MRAAALLCVLIPSIASAQSAAPPPPQPKPEVYFHAPANNAAVTSPFAVKFGLKNYGVAPVAINVARTGHFHILINVEPPPAGTLIPTDSLHRHFGGGQIETELTLAPGTYTLRLVLADHEHKVIGPDLISAPIRVTVQRARTPQP
jgi:hypothetical protein